jgi:hypothetical protein
VALSQPALYKVKSLNLEDIQEQKGFHEEFMSQLNECSSSWREAAMKEKRY